jgi:hypothetical protein
VFVKFLARARMVGLVLEIIIKTMHFLNMLMEVELSEISFESCKNP